MSATATKRYVAPPLDWREILANDALGPDATRQKASYLAKQASRRWLGDVQRATEFADLDQSRYFLAGIFTAQDLPCRRTS